MSCCCCSVLCDINGIWNFWLLCRKNSKGCTPKIAQQKGFFKRTSWRLNVYYEQKSATVNPCPLWRISANAVHWCYPCSMPYGCSSRFVRTHARSMRATNTIAVLMYFVLLVLVWKLEKVVHQHSLGFCCHLNQYENMCVWNLLHTPNRLNVFVLRRKRWLPSKQTKAQSIPFGYFCSFSSPNFVWSMMPVLRTLILCENYHFTLCYIFADNCTLRDNIKYGTLIYVAERWISHLTLSSILLHILARSSYAVK